MLNPSGDEDPKLISILPEVSTCHAPTLLLHGELDLLVFVQQAYLLRDALKATNIPYELVIYPYYGHVIRGKTSKKKRPPFLKKPPDPPAVAMLLDRFEKICFRFVRAWHPKRRVVSLND